MNKLIATPSYWLSTVAQNELPVQPPPAKADVVVVGGGIVGACCALWLARTGARVVVLERRRGLAEGATGRNAGFIVAGAAMPLSLVADRVGKEQSKNAWAASVEGQQLLYQTIHELAIPCDFRQDGHFAVASTQEEWENIQQSFDDLLEIGSPQQRLLDRKELESVNHGPLPEHFLGARFNPDDSTVNSAKLVYGILQAAMRLGVTVVTDAEVRRLDEESSQICIVSSQGKVHAGAVILATNAWTPHLLNIFSEIITPVRGQMLAVGPIYKHLIRGAWSTNYGYEYWQQTVEGNLAIGGFRWTQADWEMGYYAETLNDSIQHGLYRYITDLYPDLFGIPVSHRWAGIMAFTPDFLPLIGPVPGMPRVYMAAGWSGHGMPFAAFAAQALAEDITENQTSYPMEVFSPKRFL
ncbi:MAG: FAD-binding oxidoreductase [Chloroflexi bacterium]|nr:FAD-binding oxidoreductase [Chloroflexota bacterium]